VTRVDGRRALTALQTDDIRTALAMAERCTRLRFALYLGAPVGPRRHFAERLHAALGDDAPRAVLIYVDLDGRGLELVTGELARALLPDGQCRLTAMAMAASMRLGRVVDAILSGIGMLGSAGAR
jgi:Domain of unknown function (DUF477).